jgi:hypothetical protein
MWIICNEVICAESEVEIFFCKFLYEDMTND